MSSRYHSVWHDSVHSGAGILARSKIRSCPRQQCSHAAISLSPLSHNHDYFGKSWRWGKCRDSTGKSTQLSSLHWQRSEMTKTFLLKALDKLSSRVAKINNASLLLIVIGDLSRTISQTFDCYENSYLKSFNKPHLALNSTYGCSKPNPNVTVLDTYQTR